MSFRPFRRDDLATYAAWFDDEEVARRVSFPDADWFNYVMDPSSIAHAVVAVRTPSEAPLAVLQYDEEAEGGINLLIAVDPARRGQGFGKRILAAFVEHIDHSYTHIDGYIEDNNFASIACVERCGFIRQTEAPDDGFLFYRKLLGAKIS
ncbi:GNAT family protein [Aminobacter anthyllidis]|uniref:GNAT family N-acetyltransferase n=1 Tax=Aminobacter anthyllidis TaxID=1035067 RepID=UPI002457B950|nr:GNAT family protein [Aminobacter anthyllidis]MDH4985308.1 GNAT family protein [Aminobacter anthyllidis]